MDKDGDPPPIAAATNSPLGLCHTQSGYLSALKHGHKSEKKKTLVPDGNHFATG